VLFVDGLTLAELPLTLPPMFAEACGYRGAARYVALCWIPEERELWLSDDGHAVLGDLSAFLMICEHRATATALSAYQAANAQWGIRPWLLVDRDRRAISFGDPARVWGMLLTNHTTIATGATGGFRRPLPDPRWQRWLERGVSAWLDWAARRQKP
jgi:hypothetical protein